MLSSKLFMIKQTEKNSWEKYWETSLTSHFLDQRRLLFTQIFYSVRAQQIGEAKMRVKIFSLVSTLGKFKISFFHFPDTN